MISTMKLAIGSLVVGVAVLGLKTLAYWMTGSVALLSDALESTVNVATAIAALVAIRVASAPADEKHPYGHHKAEFFSAVLEGVMIVIAALLILREAWGGLQNPVVMEAPVAGLLVNLGATGINAVWAYLLISRGRMNRSPALVADGKHLMTDVVTSFGVAFGLLAALATGWWLLDPIMAIVVALNILWAGWKVIRDSLSGLMDESVPEEVMTKLRDIIAAESNGAMEAHDLRTRHAGPVTFIDFHLVVPGTMSVFKAHEICDRIERELESQIGGTKVTIHVEPDHKSKHDREDTQVILPK